MLTGNLRELWRLEDFYSAKEIDSREAFDRDRIIKPGAIHDGPSTSLHHAARLLGVIDRLSTTLKA